MCEMMTESLSYAMWFGGLAGMSISLILWTLADYFCTGIWPWELEKRAKRLGRKPQWWIKEE